MFDSPFGGPLLGGSPFLGFRPGLPPPGSGGGVGDSSPGWLDDSLETLGEGLTTALLDWLGVNPNNTKGVSPPTQNPPGGGDSSGSAEMQRGPNPIAVGGLSLGVISLLLVLIELVTS